MIGGSKLECRLTDRDEYQVIVEALVYIHPSNLILYQSVPFNVFYLSLSSLSLSASPATFVRIQKLSAKFPTVKIVSAFLIQKFNVIFMLKIGFPTAIGNLPQYSPLFYPHCLTVKPTVNQMVPW